MHKLAEMFNSSKTTQDYVTKYCSRLSGMLSALDSGIIAKIVDIFEQASNENRAIYFMANGGSSAVASHWVNDLLVGAFMDGKPGFRAFALGDNVESVTAIGNDAGYENIFLYQLRVNMRPGDVVFGMSVSGNSPNVIKAIEWAKENGATTIGVSGFNGGKLKNICDVSLHIESDLDEYGPVEDIFGILDHIVMTYLAMRRGKRLNH